MRRAKRLVGLVAALAVGWAIDAPAQLDPPAREPIRRGTIRDREGRVLATTEGEVRAYPFGALGVHAIGEVARRPRDAGWIGRSGVEAAWDDVLAAGDDLTLTLDVAW